MTDPIRRPPASTETPQPDHHHQPHDEHDQQVSHAHHHADPTGQQDAHGGHQGHDAHNAHGGHDAHGGQGGHGGHGDHVGQFRRLFWIMLVLAVPVVGFSGMFAMLLGYNLPAAGWVGWISPVLGTVMYAWGGRPFLTGAVDEVRRRQPGMMLLIALAITVAFLASWGASLGIVHHELDFWWELALLIVIMLLGHWIEMRSLAQTTSALDSLAALLPDEAERVVGDATVTRRPRRAAARRRGRRPPRRPGPRRRHHRRRLGQHGRVDDHRGVQARPPQRR